MMVHVSIVVGPHLNLPPLIQILAYSTLHGSLAAHWLKYEHGLKHCKACRAQSQLGAHLEWI